MVSTQLRYLLQLLLSLVDKGLSFVLKPGTSEQKAGD